MRAYRFLPFVLLSSAILLWIAVAYIGAIGLTSRISYVLGFAPSSTPFLDTETILSALRCLNRGIDVFVVNPCDPLGRVFDYSPIWLRFSVLPIQDSWTVPVGLAAISCFAFSVLLFPKPQSTVASWIISAALLSPPVVYGLERGNNDLLIFALCAVATWSLARSTVLRMVGYFCIFVAGLLKYFPLLVMIVAVRERLKVFMLVCLLSVIGMAVVLFFEWENLIRALRLIPTGTPFGDMFGSRTTAFGLVWKLHMPAGSERLLTAVLDFAALAFGIFVALPIIRNDIALLDRKTSQFLLVGALLILTCFISAQNIGYRAMHLIFLVPAITELMLRSKKLFWKLSFASIFVVLWSQALRHWVRVATTTQGMFSDPSDHADTYPTILAWFIREGSWWLIVTLCCGVVIEFVLRSRSLRDLEAVLTVFPLTDRRR